MTALDPAVDVLVPTCDRPSALAVTLSGLAAQSYDGMRVVISDQSYDAPAWEDATVAATVRILQHRGVPVELHRNLPRRGVAEQRAFLLSRASTPRVLCLDDDVWLAPGAIQRLCGALDELGCGFVGMAVQGLSYADDRRPQEHAAYEEWSTGVLPERVDREGGAWERWRLHNAANLVHLAADLDLRDDEWRAYKVAWIGGCVLYDREALLSTGGFDFWSQLPAASAGEDVVAQLRVMERYGGAGIIPSLAVHLELATTVTDRDVEAYDVVLTRGECSGSVVGREEVVGGSRNPR